jgi:hypothetical protein
MTDQRKTKTARNSGVSAITIRCHAAQAFVSTAESKEAASEPKRKNASPKERVFHFGFRTSKLAPIFEHPAATTML